VADIFVSYARDDDLPPPDRPDRKGFVSFLYDSVQYEFRDLGPNRPKIWRDINRISDGDQFTPELEGALQQASILLVVLSPNWMASQWCNRELQTFARYHGSDPQCVVVVSKHHIDFDKRPALLQGQAGFEFYVRNKDPDDITGDTEFFDRGQARDERYFDRVKALVAHLLKRKPPPPPPPPYPPSGRTIYVAKPASDMRASYDRIVSELVGRGHTVVPPPAEEIPLNAAVESIDKALSGAEISIHVLGEKAGQAPEDQLPMVKLQLARAAETAGADGSGKFHRLVWAPSLWASPAAVAGQPAQEVVRHPVDVLARFDRQLPSDKVEGDSLSKFVDFMNQHLAAIAPPRPLSALAGAGSGDISLYLYHSQEDSDYALNLAAALQQRKLDALLPVFDGPDAEIKSFNGKQLAQCDAVILCWAAASEVWVRAQASALRNWQELGRKQQFSYRAVVAAPPPGVRKKNGKLLFPRSDIDLWIDLSDKDIPSADLLDVLVPAAHAGGP
jgi:TIR domain-containing protein